MSISFLSHTFFLIGVIVITRKREGKRRKKKKWEWEGLTQRISFPLQWLRDKDRIDIVLLSLSQSSLKPNARSEVYVYMENHEFMNVWMYNEKRRNEKQKYSLFLVSCSYYCTFYCERALRVQRKFIFMPPILFRIQKKFFLRTIKILIMGILFENK